VQILLNQDFGGIPTIIGLFAIQFCGFQLAVVGSNSRRLRGAQPCSSYLLIPLLQIGRNYHVVTFRFVLFKVGGLGLDKDFLWERAGG